MRRLCFFVALLPLLAGPSLSQNKQPFSSSMIECSHILDELAILGERKGRDAPTIAKMRETALDFRIAAVGQAQSEGVSDVDSHLAALASDMDTKWSGRFSRVLAFDDNKDWIDYCFSFASHLGIETIRD